ncbi:MAG TPA: diguanylate cyclase [Bordetella sp.]
MTNRPASNNSPTQPRTLSQVLLRAHVGSALAAMCFVGLALMAAGLLQLRSTVNQNLELVARSMAFAAEAAVVFRDGPATWSAIDEIASMASVESVAVTDMQGQTLAVWRKQRANTSIAHWFQNLDFLEQSVRLPVLSHGRRVGAIRVQSSSDSIWGFLVTGLLWILACVIASIVMTAYVTQRTLHSIVHPLRQFTEVTRRVRNSRSFGERVPRADLVELNDLANDFNSLLSELEHREAGAQGEYRALEHQATHDSLTGLANRTAFEIRLRHSILRAQAKGRSFALLFIDGDNFKLINDNFGHAAGDLVLREVGRRISEQLRDNDDVARFGGDEFAVILDPVKDKGSAERVAGAIAAAMAVPIALESGQTLVASVSVGMALYPQDATDELGLLEHADATMYARKASRGDAGTHTQPAV